MAEAERCRHEIVHRPSRNERREPQGDDDRHLGRLMDRSQVGREEDEARSEQGRGDVRAKRHR